MWEVLFGVLAVMFCFVGTIALTELARAHSSSGTQMTQRLAAWCFILMALSLMIAMSGCQSIEGAGFSNRGAYQGRVCKEKTSYGERWFSC